MNSPTHRVCFPYIGDAVGGSHLSSLLLVSNLVGTGYEPLVVVHKRGRLTRLLEHFGVEYRLLRLPGYDAAVKGGKITRFSIIPSVVPPVARFLRRERVSIVHTNDDRIHAMWALPTRLAGCP